MFSPLILILIVCAYVGFLFLSALWVERGSRLGKRWAESPVVYSMALAVYCTSWTFYGSVGNAATSGMLFLAVYLGPTLAIILWWFVLRKLVRIKSTHRITSIADFISARYEKSQALAAIASLLALIGTVPYIALQLKAVTSTFTLITASSATSNNWITNNVGIVVVVLMIAFTIAFGARRLDPTERHEGLVMALALESLVKLVAFLAVGIFVTYLLFNGFDDLFQRFSQSSFSNLLNTGTGELGGSYLFVTQIILGMSAIQFLPRQFHVAVVENSNEKHIRTAMWLFTLYMLLITFFAAPIAMGGLLEGLPATQADTFVLALPMQYGSRLLTLLVFIGGFSAATGMLIVEAMAVATMVTNHLLLPVIESVSGLGFLRRYLLRIRWVAVAFNIAIGYWFARAIGGSYTLVNMGIISFAAVLQFAPVILGGLFWRQGNKRGAILGLSAGFVVWFYTLMVPSFVKSDWLPSTLLENGLFGIAFLKPEQLFGLTGLHPTVHAVFWSMVFNIGLYVLGSIFFEQSTEEQQIAEAFVGALTTRKTVRSLVTAHATVNLAEKSQKIGGLLRQYFNASETGTLIERCCRNARIVGKDQVSVAELADLFGEVEKVLAGAVGAAAAHKAVTTALAYSPEEQAELSTAYSQILSQLRVTPEELQKRIDFYQERETLLTAHTAELEMKVAERTKALVTATEVSRRISGSINIARQQLIVEVVEVVNSSFDFYHTQIYFFDPTGNELVLEAATGEAGKIMLQKGHRISKGKGLVGRAAETNVPVLVSDVSADPGWLPNPLLPETKSELAVPISSGELVIGVLDVQHNIPHGLGTEHEGVLQTVANQIMIASQNARLLMDAEQRAEREALITSISQKIQNTTTLENALQVAVREVGRALGAKAKVQLVQSNQRMDDK